MQGINNMSIELTPPESVSHTDVLSPPAPIKPVEKESPMTSVHKFENDWFDKLLDFFAAIVGSVSGMFCR